MGRFTADLSRFRVKTEKQAEAVVRKIILDAHGRIVRRSPVDTGRFRANNQVSLNSLPTTSTIEVDKAGNATILAGGTVMASFKLGDTVFIYNNLTYALALEYGHSKQQAPQGVYRITALEIINHIEGAGA